MPFSFFILSSSSDDGWIWAVAGACAGVYLFYTGFRDLQRKRLIQNTPSSKIRSASMGLLEVSGLATGPYTMPAPITGMPCYYYRTMAWQWTQSGKNKSWKKVADESLHVPFYLDDNTGRVLIDPQGAEMDIHRDFHEEFSSSIFSSSLEIPANVSGFLMRHGVSGDQKVKVEEYCIKPKNALFILGTLAENTDLEVGPTPVRSVSVNPHKFRLRMPGLIGGLTGGLIGGSTGGLFAADTEWTSGVTLSHSTTLAPLLGTSERARAQQTNRPGTAAHSSGPTDMPEQARIASALMKAGITNPAAWAAAGVQYPGVTGAAGSNIDRAGISTASATDEFDLTPKTVLRKGEHNPAFLISWQSQRDVLRALGWKSTLMIWGGPALSLLCVYLLAAKFDWL